MKSVPHLLYFVVLVLVCVFVSFSFYGYKIDYSYVSATATNEFPSARMKSIYVQQSSGRREVMRSILRNREMSLGTFYNVLVPEVFCSELVRIGTIGDGGKWMCSPQEMPKGCIVLSLGLNNAVSWDLHLQKLTNKRCRLIGYDSKQQRPETKKQLEDVNGVSKVGFIASVDGPNNRISLETIAKQNDIKHIEMFKVDIEGSEFEVLVPFLTYHTASQILIEIHAREPVKKPAAHKFVDLLSQLNRLGYLIANYEINGGFHELSGLDNKSIRDDRIPLGLSEKGARVDSDGVFHSKTDKKFTLVHRSALQRYNAFPLAEYMDILEH